jgi:hypothetical protein
MRRGHLDNTTFFVLPKIVILKRESRKAVMVPFLQNAGIHMFIKEVKSIFRYMIKCKILSFSAMIIKHRIGAESIIMSGLLSYKSLSLFDSQVLSA